MLRATVEVAIIEPRVDCAALDSTDNETIDVSGALPRRFALYRSTGLAVAAYGLHVIDATLVIGVTFKRNKITPAAIRLCGNRPMNEIDVA